MGKQSLNLHFILPTILSFILLGSLSSSNLFAQKQTALQDKEVSSTASGEKSWRDWLGFRASISINNIGVNIPPSLGFSQSRLATPQLGSRVQLGVILDKSNPLIVAVGLSRAQNLDKETKGLIATTSLLDMGLEFTMWKLLRKDRHKLDFDMGAFASMCSITPPDATAYHKWGVVAELALTYHYKLRENLSIGAKLYNHFGKYFGKSQVTNHIPFSYSDELGLAFFVSF